MLIDVSAMLIYVSVMLIDISAMLIDVSAMLIDVSVMLISIIVICSGRSVMRSGRYLKFVGLCDAHLSLCGLHKGCSARSLLTAPSDRWVDCTSPFCRVCKPLLLTVHALLHPHLLSPLSNHNCIPTVTPCTLTVAYPQSPPTHPQLHTHSCTCTQGCKAPFAPTVALNSPPLLTQLQKNAIPGVRHGYRQAPWVAPSCTHPCTSSCLL